MSSVFAQTLSNTKNTAVETKQEILALARSYAGMGDPDFSKQKSFEPLIEKLLKQKPQPPVRERVKLLSGAWKQIWGPYNYRGSERTVDPEIGVNEIYQVVFPGGYYYNVTTLTKQGDTNSERIGLLRGEYDFDNNQSNVLQVRFTQYPGLSKRPDAPIELFYLPELIESGKLQNDINIVPTIFVKLFFGGGALKEVYTDEDLRILYGSRSDKFEQSALYIMTRVSKR